MIVEEKGWDFLVDNMDLQTQCFEIEVNLLLESRAFTCLSDDQKEAVKRILLEAKDKLDHRAKIEQDIKSNGTQGKKNHDAKVDSEVVYEFGGPIGAVLIMLFSHAIMYYLWLSAIKHNGALFIPVYSDLQHIVHDCTPTADILGFYVAFVIFQAFLGASLPGFRVSGLPIPSENNQMLSYNCNGIVSWWITLLTLFALEYYDAFHLSTLADNYGKLMTVMILFGDLVSIVIYVSGLVLRRTHRMSGNHIYDFFMGSWLNPRIGSFDLKLWAEVRVSWFTLFILTLSCVMKQYDEGGLANVHPGLWVLLLAHWLYTNACVKGEECIVTTWDIFYEKWGWMLIFWNFAGVPIVYTWNSFYILNTNPTLSTECGILLALVLLVTYYIWDTSNSQKNRFRMQLRGTYQQRPWYVFPQLPWGTLEKPVAIKTRHGNRLLVSGWYGLSKTRKIHYLMDILFALEWGLAAGVGNLLPYFYLIFFSSFIMHRGVRDNERCAKKYGKDWDRYCRIVPYILIPGIW